jgi:rhodanese-related sulfurtransferase
MSVPDDQAYAGDISADQAYEMLAKDQGATLIDVRTEPEWRYVGAPDLSALDKTVIYLHWQVYPSMQTLPNFVGALTQELGTRGVAESDPLLFLCRSGARSRAAAIAMTAAGWKSSYNIADGFEGPLDSARHRGAADGWKASGLPWTQT